MDAGSLEAGLSDAAEREPDRGASLVEYSLLLALIAVVCIVAVTTLGNEASDSFQSSASSLFP